MPRSSRPRAFRCAIERLESRVLLSGTYDIDGVQPVALDQPQIHGFLRRNPNDPPLMGSASGLTSFDVQGFLDTGTSEVLLSQETAQALGIRSEVVNGQTATFTDIGIGGGENFDVSEPLYTALAPFTDTADVDNPSTYQTVYNQTFGPLRTEINRQPADELIGPLDIFGMPTMQGKMVVMDPTPLNDQNNLGNMRTYIYNPGTPYHAQTKTSDPGIPNVNLHVKLSYGSFAQFTQLTPAGAAGPTLDANPFIGPDPLLKLQTNPPPDNTPPVSIAEGTYSSTGSFLFDTGAAASFVSQAEANAVHVHYKAGTYGTDNPVLVDDSGKAIPNQFTEQIGGIGGAVTAAGFFLDSLTLPTIEGTPVRFVHAPVLVADVTVQDPKTGQMLTLDGDFGMNFLVASAFVNGLNFGATNAGPFDWLTFDQPHGVLGLDLPNAVPTGPSVVGRFVFYNHSAFDGNNPTINAQDDNAIATDKRALLPGGTATFADYTSYSNGINGIMVDVANLAGAPTASDFSFRVGNTNTPSSWTAAPAPTKMVLRPGAGAGGSTRIEITWPDGAIKNEWLQVTVKADAATGLSSPDVFYFGNAIGESGNSTADAIVNTADEMAARSDPHNFMNVATITNPHDYNRDGRVDATDQLIARTNGTNAATALLLIKPATTATAAAAVKTVQTTATRRSHVIRLKHHHVTHRSRTLLRRALRMLMDSR